MGEYCPPAGPMAMMEFVPLGGWSLDNGTGMELYQREGAWMAQSLSARLASPLPPLEGLTPKVNLLHAVRT